MISASHERAFYNCQILVIGEDVFATSTIDFTTGKSLTETSHCRKGAVSFERPA